MINCAQLVSQESSSKTGSAINATFKDARLMDAVLVLEDFQVGQVNLNCNVLVTTEYAVRLEDFIKRAVPRHRIESSGML